MNSKLYIKTKLFCLNETVRSQHRTVKDRNHQRRCDKTPAGEFTTSILIDDYRLRLTRSGEEERERIYGDIGQSHDADVLDLLISGLSDPSVRVRSTVAAIMKSVADASMTTRLLETLRNENTALRSRVMTVLADLVPGHLDQIRSYLKDEDPDMRIYTATILGNSGEALTFSDLKSILADPQENVRYAGVEALGKIGNPLAVPCLLDMLEDPWAKFPAIEALGALQAAEAVEPLIAIGRRDAAARPTAVEALGHIGHAGAVEFLLRMLGAEDIDLRVEALAALVNIESAFSCGVFSRLGRQPSLVVPTALGALQSVDPVKRKTALRVLGRIGDASHLTVVLDYLEDEPHVVAAEARSALERLGSRHPDELAGLYQDSSAAVQQQIVKIAGAVGGPTAARLLAEALAHPDASVREAAAKMLAAPSTGLCVERLTAHLNDGDWRMRKICLEGIGQNAPPQTLENLARLLEDSSREVREAAADALARQGGSPVWHHVRPLLDHPQPPVRAAAVRCIGQIDTDRTRGLLIRALKDPDPSVRRAAAESAGRHRVNSAVELLIAGLADKDWMVRKASAAALGHIGNPNAAAPLQNALADGSLWVRYAAVEALGRIGETTVIEALRAVAHDDAVPVRIAAVEALEKLEAPELDALLGRMLDDPDMEIRRTAENALDRRTAGPTGSLTA